MAASNYQTAARPAGDCQRQPATSTDCCTGVLLLRLLLCVSASSPLTVAATQVEIVSYSIGSDDSYGVGSVASYDSYVCLVSVDYQSIGLS